MGRSARSRQPGRSGREPGEPYDASVANDEGWQPIAPARQGGRVVRPGTVSRFTRLARTHALMAAGDAVVAVALASSVFFDMDPSGARWRVGLFLLLTVAPFTIVSPFIGPAIDRMAGGRRLVVILVAAGRTIVSLLLVAHIDSTFLVFPEALISLVLGKAYAVSKSALVPTVVNNDQELVEANAKLGVIAGVLGFAAAVPAALLRLASPKATMALAVLLFGGAIITALALPAEVVAAKPAGRAARLELHSGRITLAAMSMSTIRAMVGFLTFLLAFWLRRRGVSPAWFGFALSGSAIGTLIGNAISPRLRLRVREELMLLGSLAITAFVAVGATVAPSRFTGVLLASAMGFAAAVGRLAFDSIVQSDAPDANRGQAFAQFETRFQLAWVFAAFVPVVLPIPGGIGFAMLAVMGMIAVAATIVGNRALKAGGQLPPVLTGGVVRKVVAEQRRRRAAGRAPST